MSNTYRDTTTFSHKTKSPLKAMHDGTSKKHSKVIKAQKAKSQRLDEKSALRSSLVDESDTVLPHKKNTL